MLVFEGVLPEVFTVFERYVFGGPSQTSGGVPGMSRVKMEMCST